MCCRASPAPRYGRSAPRSGSASRSATSCCSRTSTSTRRADARWHINLLCVALAGLFLYDLVLYADAVLFHRVSEPLFEGRASATAIAAPLIAVAAARNRRWAIDLHVSRDVVFHTATLVVSGVFLLGLAATGEIFRRGGAEWGYVAEVSLIFAGDAGRSRCCSPPARHARASGRSWSITSSATATTIAANGCAASTRSPRRPHTPACRCGRSARWPRWWTARPACCSCARRRRWRSNGPGPGTCRRRHSRFRRDIGLVAEFRDGDWIVELDKLPPVAEWASELTRTWLAVPLNHQGNLIGFVVLARSRAQFKLDREVFDLLRIIGREVASRVAEQLAAQVLSQTQAIARIQPAVRLRHPRHKECFRPAFDAAHQCRGPCRQSGVPARHAGDGARLGGQDHPAADTAAGGSAGARAMR